MGFWELFHILESAEGFGYVEDAAEFEDPVGLDQEVWEIGAHETQAEDGDVKGGSEQWHLLDVALDHMVIAWPLELTGIKWVDFVRNLSSPSLLQLFLQPPFATSKITYGQRPTFKPLLEFGSFINDLLNNDI